MHIPDGFLSLPISLISLTATGAVGFLSHERLKTTINQEHKNTIPLISCSAGFVFATQMLNFPVLAGTSGHFLGAAFVTSLFGPFVAFFIMACVLTIQSLFFADGGLLALGANILCMGIAAPWAFLLVRKISFYLFKNHSIAILAASWASVVFAAFTCSSLVALSGTAPFISTCIAMCSVHSLIGIGEALITATAITFLAKANIIHVLKAQNEVTT